MSISTTDRKVGPYTGNGSASTFAFDFKIFASTDLLVVKTTLATGAEQVLALTTDFTLATNADQDANPGGSITLTAGALATGYSLTIASQVPETQGVTFTNTGGFFPALLNKALDKLTVLVQQVSEKVGRSLKMPVSTATGFNAELPAPVPYGVVGFNGTATGFAVTDPSGSSALISDLASSSVGKGSAMVAATLRKTGAVARTVEDALSDWVSVKAFGAKLDGTTDDLNAYYKAIQSGEPRILVPWGGGSSVITEEILIQDRDSIELMFPRGFTLKCMGAWRAGRAGIKIDNANNIRIYNVNIRGQRTAWSGVMADADNSPIDFGIYSTSTGTGAAGNNRFERCDANYVRDSCFQIGNADVGVIDQTTDEHQIIYCSGTFAPHCLTISQANTNMTKVEGGWMTNYSQDGVRVINNARGVVIDGTMFYTFYGTGSSACMRLAKENSGPVALLNLVTEQYQGTWLTVEPTSAGLSNKNMLTIENANVTNNDNTVGQKLIDYQGAGSVAIRNSRFGGAGSLRGGVGAKLSFQPQNADIGGTQVLITEGCELYDGATWDVQTDNNSAWFRWVDVLTTLRASGVGAGEGALPTPLVREMGRINHEIQQLTPINLLPGGTTKSYGKIGQGWLKVTVDKSAFVAASTSAEYYFCTLPPKTRVLAIYTETTQAFAGVTNPTLAVQNAGTVLLKAHLVNTTVTKGLASADLDTAMTTGLVQGAYLPSWTGGSTQLRLQLVSGGGNIGNGTTTNLTAGSVDVYVLVDVPPSY